MTDQELPIPIPEYPTFKLRSSLIDKDPVIWVHLLEGYIQLFEYLCQPQDVKLSIKSQQELYGFLKGYLRETSNEESQIFSLGAINPDIKKNTATLRVFVFQFIKLSSLVKCKLLGESIWDFISIYVAKNYSTVRQLVDGSFKSKLNDNKKSGSISSISLVQKCLENKIINGKFSDRDLQTLTSLLGQQIGLQKQTKISIIDQENRQEKVLKSDKIKSSKSIVFSQQFVNVAWIEMLEKLYAKGNSVHAKVIEKIMVVSLLSLSTALISKLLTELSVTSIASLKLFPLVGTILLSDSFQEMVPNLHSKIPFLQGVVVAGAVDDESMKMIEELFPQMSIERTKELLQEHNGDVETLTNLLFEQPDLMKDTEKSQVPAKNKEIAKRSIYDDDKISKLDFQGTKVIVGKETKKQEIDPNEELRKRTLAAAMRFMNEDEPDDTYDDNGLGEAYDTQRMDSLIDGRNVHRLNETEHELYFMYRQNGEKYFLRTGRNLVGRDQIKDLTRWTDEQIEGWYRMMKSSPDRLERLQHDFKYNSRRHGTIMLCPDERVDYFADNTAPQENSTKDKVKKGKAKKSKGKN